VSPTSVRNLWLFTIVGSLWAGIYGLIGPFFVLHVEKLSGGMEKLGFAFSIMIFVQSFTTYFAGRISDRFGRKPFLFIIAYVDAVILFLYTVISNEYQLYALQACMGLTNGMAGAVSASFLGDLTVREGRGRAVGRFGALVSLCSAVGVSMSGFVAKIYGINVLLCLAAIVVAASTVILVPIREEPFEKAETATAFSETGA
jgi:DHA1 family multidrug resistance protein-like MFS transporter